MKGNYLMPTDELEGQLRSALARAAADFENPGQARQRLLQRDYHPRRGNRRLAAGITTGAALVVGLVAVIAAVAHGPATKALSLGAPAVRTRLLAAIDTASGDILYAHGGASPGGGTWQSPAYPRPGEKVHIRNLGLGSGGVIFKDGEYSFTMPSGKDAANSYASNLDQGGLQLSGTVMDVNYFRHLWGEWHAKFVLGFTLDAAGIRAEIANGQFKVVGLTELHGQKAVELAINVPSSSESPPHVTTARLWVERHDLPADAAVPAHVQWTAECHAVHLPPAHSREPGEAPPSDPDGLHAGGPRPGDWPEAEDDQEVAGPPAVSRLVAGPREAVWLPDAKLSAHSAEPFPCRVPVLLQEVSTEHVKFGPHHRDHRRLARLSPTRCQELGDSQTDAI